MQYTTAKYSGALIFAAALAANPLTASAVKAADIKIGAPLALTGAVSDEAKKQESGEAGLGAKGNPGQPGAPVNLMPDGRPLPQ